MGRSKDSVRVSRRGFLAGTAAIGAAATFGVSAPAVLAQSRKPLKIGMVNTFSKVYAVLGNNQLDAMNLWFEHHGGPTVAGRKVEIIREDDELNPQIGLQKLKKLVESDQVDIVCGPQVSSVAMAMVDYVKANKVFWLESGAGTTALTWNRIPYMFRTSLSGWQQAYAIGDWFYDNVAHEAVVAASDFAGGQDVIAEFKRVPSKKVKIIKEIYPPLGTADYSPYLADIRSMNAKGMYCFFAGADAVRFVKQYAVYGLKAQTRLCSSGFMVEPDTLPAQGDDALGIVSSLHYADTLDNPANKEFVAAYHGKYKAFPSVYAEYGWVTARVISDALKATDGDTSNKDKLAEAVGAVKFGAPRGPFSFDPVTHNPIMNMYVREVAKVDGRLTNKVIGTFKDVRDPGVKPS
jgi:branched-chain amino acid transport system substrate-binding protein